MSKIEYSVDSEVAKKIHDLLQPTLVELIDIALTGKQLHWTIIGQRFKDVHEHLDEIIDSVRVHSDDIAEYITTVGQIPDGTAGTVAKGRPFEDVPIESIDVEDVLNYTAQMLKTASQNIRGRIDAADIDPVGQDHLIQTAATLDKHLWMISASR
ncbi:DNA starvation/stationary phase protection protein [Stomatohabitans albus]|uniref:Dps family protein n=1 Tax=Stomatohabitans albus TaxID=3110766 RepID=UPI00300D1B3C